VAFLISLITTAVFAVGLIASGGEAPDDSRFGSAPWWAWVGGLCGAAYVTSTFFAKSMGAGIFTGLTITAGIVVSIGLDHFGLIGFQQHSAGFLRIAGAALMIVGLTLVARF
jgi:transporter family-2 protein